MAILRRILDDFETDAHCLALLRNPDHEPIAQLIEKVEGCALPRSDE